MLGVAVGKQIASAPDTPTVARAQEDQEEEEPILMSREPGVARQSEEDEELEGGVAMTREFDGQVNRAEEDEIEDEAL